MIAVVVGSPHCNGLSWQRCQGLDMVNALQNVTVLNATMIFLKRRNAKRKIVKTYIPPLKYSKTLYLNW